MADLQRNIDEVEELFIGQLCSLAHLEQGGSLAARKERLSTFLAGPSRRQRKGWLQFFMHVVDADSVGPSPYFAVDYDKLDHAVVEVDFVTRDSMIPKDFAYVIFMHYIRSCVHLHAG